MKKKTKNKKQNKKKKKKKKKIKKKKKKKKKKNITINLQKKNIKIIPKAPLETDIGYTKMIESLNTIQNLIITPIELRKTCYSNTILTWYNIAIHLTTRRFIRNIQNARQVASWH